MWIELIELNAMPQINFDPFPLRCQGQNHYRQYWACVLCLFVLMGWIILFDLTKMTSLAFTELFQRLSNLLWRMTCRSCWCLKCGIRHLWLYLKFTLLFCVTENNNASVPSCQHTADLTRSKFTIWHANTHLERENIGWVISGDIFSLYCNLQKAKWPSKKPSLSILVICWNAASEKSDSAANPACISSKWFEFKHTRWHCLWASIHILETFK